MNNVKIKLNTKAIGAMLKSDPGIRGALFEQGYRIANEAGNSEVHMEVLKSRMRIGVEQEQTRSDREDHTLLRAVHFQ